MMWQTVIRGAILSACVFTFVGCGDSDGAAATTGPSPSINLTGTWVGTIAAEGEGDAPRVTWTASQTGSQLSGPMVVSFEEDGEEFRLNGTMNGTLSGSQLEIAFTIPAGSIADAPNCSISGTGTSTPTATSIKSTITVRFAPGCQGNVADHEVETDTLSLTRQ